MLRYSALLSSSAETNLAIRDAFYFISSLSLTLPTDMSCYTPPLPHFSPAFVITQQHPNLSCVSSSRVASLGSRPEEHDSINQTPLKEDEEEESLLRADQQKIKLERDPLTTSTLPSCYPDCCRERQSIEHRYILRYFGASSSLGIFAASSRLAEDAKRYIEKLGQRSAAAFFCD